MMARAPYEPFDTTAPFNPRQPREQLDVNATGEGFGANIGAAIEHLGVTGENVSNELFQRAVAIQNLKNEKDATDQVVNTNQQIAMENKNFEALGEQAGNPDNLKAHLDKINQLRLDGRSKLTNPTAQQMFDREAASIQNRSVFTAGEISGNAFKKSVIGTAEAQMDLDTRAWTDPQDEGEFDQKASTIQRNSATVAGAAGLDSTQEQDYTFKRTSALRESQIHQLALTNSNAALDMLDRPDIKKQMGDDAWNKAYDFAINQNRTVGATYLTNQIYDAKKPLAEMEQEVRDKATKLARGSDQDKSIFVNNAVNALRTRFNQDKWTDQQQEHTFQQSIYDAINSGKYKSVQEMQADPTIGVAVNGVSGSFRETLQSKLNSYWKAKDQQGNEENYHRLWGEAASDPQKFLNEDLYDFTTQLNDQQRGKLLMIRNQILKGAGPAADPQVTKAAAAIKRIFPNSVPQQGTDAYNSFMGTLQGELEDYLSQKKGKITSPDEYEKIGRAVLSTVPHTGIFHDSRIYELEAPQEVLDHYHAQGYDDDDEINYMYRRARATEQFQKLFGGVTSAKPE